MSDDKVVPSSDYFKLSLEEKRKSIGLSSRVEELEDRLADALAQLAQSVPRTSAERQVRSGYVAGQLKGKKELEDKLVFPPQPERTVLFSELKSAYPKSLVNNRAVGGKKKPPERNTLAEYDRSIGSFVVIIGNLRIGAIDREVVGEYFARLRKLPAHTNIKPSSSQFEIGLEYRGVTVRREASWYLAGRDWGV
jgi:hypothetical protein